MQTAAHVHDRSDAGAGNASVTAQRMIDQEGPVASPHEVALAQSPRMVAQQQRLVQMQTGAARQPAAVLQRAIDRARLNLVGENHGHYQGAPRLRQKQRVEQILGQGSYQTEDVLSALPDIREEGDSEDEKDLLHNFASKADPPYYSIVQGLEFIELWCSQYQVYPQDAALVTLINGAQRRIEADIDRGSLARMTDSDEEAMFVHQHDLMLVSLGEVSDPNYPRANLIIRTPPYQVGAESPEQLRQLPRRDLQQEFRQRIMQLRLATIQYRQAIEHAYAGARQEFEAFLGINPQAPTVQKRSVTMGFHAMVYALHGHTGVVKLGELHIQDLANEDLGNVTLSSDQELEDFLTHEEQAQNGNGDGQADL